MNIQQLDSFLAENPGADLYGEIGVKPEASAEEIKKAVRVKLMKFHPDRNTEPGAGEKFARYNTISQILEDPEFRKEYDGRRVSGSAPGGTAGKGPESGHAAPKGEGQKAHGDPDGRKEPGFNTSGGSQKGADAAASTGGNGGRTPPPENPAHGRGASPSAGGPAKKWNFLSPKGIGAALVFALATWGGLKYLESSQEEKLDKVGRTFVPPGGSGAPAVPHDKRFDTHVDFANDSAKLALGDPANQKELKVQPQQALNLTLLLGDKEVRKAVAGEMAREGKAKLVLRSLQPEDLKKPAWTPFLGKVPGADLAEGKRPWGVAQVGDRVVLVKVGADGMGKGETQLFYEPDKVTLTSAGGSVEARLPAAVQLKDPAPEALKAPEKGSAGGTPAYQYKYLGSDPSKSAHKP